VTIWLLVQIGCPNEYSCFPNCSIQQKAGGDIKHNREVYNTEVYMNTLKPNSKIERHTEGLMNSSTKPKHQIYQIRTV